MDEENDIARRRRQRIEAVARTVRPIAADRTEPIVAVAGACLGCGGYGGIDVTRAASSSGGPVFIWGVRDDKAGAVALVLCAPCTEFAHEARRIAAGRATVAGFLWTLQQAIRENARTDGGTGSFAARFSEALAACPL